MVNKNKQPTHKSETINNEKYDVRKDTRRQLSKAALIAAGGAFALGAGANFIHDELSKESDPNRFAAHAMENSDQIEEISVTGTIHDSAKQRNLDKSPTQIGSVSEQDQISFEPSGDVYSVNGYVGIPVEDLESAGAKVGYDQDGIAWVDNADVDITTAEDTANRVEISNLGDETAQTVPVKTSVEPNDPSTGQLPY